MRKGVRAVVFLLAPAGVCRQTAIVLNNHCIEQYKNRVTINAKFVVQQIAPGPIPWERPATCAVRGSQ